MIHIAHALVADEGGKPGFEEVQEEEEEEQGTNAGFDVAVHRLVYMIIAAFPTCIESLLLAIIFSTQRSSMKRLLTMLVLSMMLTRVESSSEGDEVPASASASGGKSTAPVLNLECFHTGIS